MKTIKTSELHPVKMTAKTLVFEDANHESYMATRRVANDILTHSVEEVSIIETTLPRRNSLGEPHPVKMLATPSCW